MNELEKVEINLKDNYLDNVGFEEVFEELKLLNCEEIKLDVSENNIVQID